MKLKNWKFILLGILMILTLVSPAEKRLGSVAKLVYLHGALSWVISILLLITAVLAIVSLFKKDIYSTARASLKVSLGFQLVNIIMVPIVTGLTWGVFFAWQEPRVILTFFLLGLTLAIYLIEDSFTYTLIGSLLLSLPGIGRLLTLGQIGRLLHPVNPIGSSDSMAIKGISMGIFLVALALGIVWLIDMAYRERLKRV